MFWIRRAEAHDLEAISGLLSACGLPPDDLTTGHLRFFVVADHDGRIRGVAGLEPMGEQGLVRSLAVSPDFRGQGVAGRLLKEIEAVAREYGVQRLFGLTTTAEAYLTLHGYARIDRKTVPPGIASTEQFRTICPLEAICLEKRLA